MCSLLFFAAAKANTAVAFHPNNETVHLKHFSGEAVVGRKVLNHVANVNFAFIFVVGLFVIGAILFIELKRTDAPLEGKISSRDTESDAALEPVDAVGLTEETNGAGEHKI